MISNNLRSRIFTSLILFCLFVLIFFSSFFLVFTILVLGTLSILEFLSIIGKIIKKRLVKFLVNLFFIIFIFAFCLWFFYFTNYPQFRMIIFSILVSCFASDIGGFVFGKIFKGPKLTKISPNKTISGSAGSIIFTNVIFCGIIFLITNNFSLNFLIIATIISVACQLGDLFFSYLKRKAKIKDTGNLLPGHGGVLDRLDGIYLGAPIGFIALVLFY